MIQNRQGFTLIEILAAIVIFAILLTTLFGSFRLLYSSSDALGKGTGQIEMVQNCLKRIAADLEAVYVRQLPAYRQPDTEESPDPYRFEGDSIYLEGDSFPKLRFTSLEHISFGGNKAQGIGEIVYYVTTAKNGDKVLRRSDQLFPYEKFEEKNTDPILCRSIRSLTFKYYDAAGEEHDDWDSEASEYHYSTPRSVSIMIGTGDEENPLTLQTRIFLPVFREMRE